MLRFLLAMSVVFRHTAWGASGPMISASLAVQVFFILSGFYMSLVLTGKYRLPSGKADLGAFWSARLFRLMPGYWVALGVTLLVMGGSVFAVAQGLPTWVQVWAFLSNIFIVGLDGLLFIQNVGGVISAREAFAAADYQPHHLMVIPVAWTLSLEIAFYAMAPWLVRWRTTWLLAACGGAVLARVFAAQMGLWNDPWAYRFLPFEMVFFLLGILIHRLYASRVFLPKWASLGLFSLLFLFPILPSLSIFGVDWRTLALFGLTAATVPTLFNLTKDSSADRAIGELSYPIYLIHYAVILVMPAWHPFVVAGCAILAGIALRVGIEMPIEKLKSVRLART